MPVAQLLKGISSRELAEWEAFEQVYGPVGVEARLDLAAARIVARLTNIFQPQRNGQTYEASDFLAAWAARPVEGYELREEDADAEPDA
ncbi:hypothetical protein ACIBG7_43265 [Nonomuraea sp. NPDC050328]|uniref:phage tail assembly protein T n=1 Tax=Nonomuraea sp. NPDC050328 TaxID=3364361 RepID=UPI0037B94D9A